MKLVSICPGSVVQIEGVCGKCVIGTVQWLATTGNKTVACVASKSGRVQYADVSRCRLVALYFDKKYFGADGTTMEESAVFCQNR